MPLSHYLFKLFVRLKGDNAYQIFSKLLRPSKCSINKWMLFLFFLVASLCSEAGGALCLIPSRYVEARLKGKKSSMGLAHSLGLRGEALECLSGC